MTHLMNQGKPGEMIRRFSDVPSGRPPMPGKQPFRPTLIGLSPKSGVIPVNKIVNNTPTA